MKTFRHNGMTVQLSSMRRRFIKVPKNVIKWLNDLNVDKIDTFKRQKKKKKKQFTCFGHLLLLTAYLPLTMEYLAGVRSRESVLQQ